MRVVVKMHRRCLDDMQADAIRIDEGVFKFVHDSESPVRLTLHTPGGQPGNHKALVPRAG